jgi:hypothetical protein
MRDSTWLENYLTERMTPMLQAIEQELEILKNKKPKTNAKKHRERTNVVTQKLEVSRRIREKLLGVQMNIEAVGSGEIQETLKPFLK